MTELELLAPARTADIGIEAIRHGADAVYIGAETFGARKAACNSVEDISKLVDFAHLFDAKVYVTVNTILYDKELSAVENLIHELHAIGVDALIVQDLGLLRLNLPPIPLHASTQMDNRTPEKVKALEKMGFQQVVLARELTLDDIRAIHAECPQTKLEAFVHGALCVSLSGRCYASEALFKRSANRGECAQLCRMSMDLVDGDGKVHARGKHLLSLKDLCLIDSLEDLALAGITSFKIEGRLKDMNYVKNVTAAYSEALDRIIALHSDRFRRSSSGSIDLHFKPEVEKSFNRGFTHYFLHGNNDQIFSPDTPKAIGKHVGRIKDIFTDSIVVDPHGCSNIHFNNGDGLCCFDQGGHLIGFRINRADGCRLYMIRVPHNLRKGMRLYRNYDKQFEDTLAGTSATRYLPIDMTFDYTPEQQQFSLSVTGAGTTTISHFHYEPAPARTPQNENIQKQLSKLGNTPFRLRRLSLNHIGTHFIPASMLSEWRREAINTFLAERTSSTKQPPIAVATPDTPPIRCFLGADRLFGEPTFNSKEKVGYHHNVANSLAADVYKEAGATIVDPAYELQHQSHAVLMTCRHCIRYAMGWCAHKQAKNIASAPSDPLFLVLQNGKRLQLEFDCHQCVMRVRDTR